MQRYKAKCALTERRALVVGSIAMNERTGAIPSLQALDATVLTANATAETTAYKTDNDVGVLDPLPRELDAKIYGNENPAQKVVRINVLTWSEEERHMYVSFVGSGDSSEQMDRARHLAAYLIANLGVRYEYDAIPPKPARISMWKKGSNDSSKIVGMWEFRLREEHADQAAIDASARKYDSHHQMWDLHDEQTRRRLRDAGRRPRGGAPRPLGPQTAEEINFFFGFNYFDAIEKLGGYHTFSLKFSSPTVDPSLWSPFPNDYSRARVCAFPAEARKVTRVVEQWVRDVYAPSIEHKGTVKTTQWNVRAAWGPNSVFVGLSADMPVANRRSRDARAEVRQAGAITSAAY